METKIVYGVNDKPKFGKLILFALQQVLAVLAATIAVPTIIGLPVQIPAAILGALSINLEIGSNIAFDTNTLIVIEISPYAQTNINVINFIF